MACRSVFSWRMRLASSESGRIIAGSLAFQGVTWSRKAVIHLFAD